MAQSSSIHRNGPAALPALPALLCLAAHAAAAAAAADSCDRACLKGHMDRYVEALVKHDVAALPLAANARVIHNGVAASVDDEDWKLIDGIAYRQYAMDPATGEVALFGVANENFKRGTLFVRLAVKNQQLTLVETIAGVRTPDGIPGLISPNPLFDYVLPPRQRRSRQALVRIADSYFEGLEQHTSGQVPVSADCRRIEDGVQTSLNPVFVQLTCNDFRPFTYIVKVDQRAYPIVDEERGLVLGQVVLKVPQVAPPPAAPAAPAAPATPATPATPAANANAANAPAAPARPPVNPVSGMVLPPSEWRSKPRDTIIHELFKVIDGKIVEIQTIRLDRPPGTGGGW